MNRKLSYIFMACLLLSCSKGFDGRDTISPDQQDLLGRAVSFSASIADEFRQTKATYRDDGTFNENDLMRIYREYDKGGSWGDMAYRTYHFNTKYATGTIVSLGTDWRVFVGRTGYNSVGDALHKNPGTFTQAERDSLTWEDGRTVRFRAWSRSNYANCLEGCYEPGSNGITNYYPDFCVSDWVTVSGPTSQIPLVLRHICSRIAFSYRNNGSQFYKVEVATSLEDYKRADNADTNEHDTSASESGKSDDQAQEELNSVLAAYNRMCMPAGVDINDSKLYAMTMAYWSSASSDNLRKLEDENVSTFYQYGTQNNTYIKDYVQRPVFANVNNSCYLVTIPYDMSSDVTGGDVITLPACTRFRVYMRDVNNGDGNHTGGYEGQYHIFSLSDIKNGDGTTKYPNGLDMLPGYSYKFYVGYRYKQLTITAADNFSWAAQDLEAAQFKDDIHDIPEPSTSNYSWWKTTIKNAIPTTSGGDFNPEFHIRTQQEFIEFINLVNGTAATRTDGLYRGVRKTPNPEHAGNSYDLHNWWYTSVSPNKRDTTWVTTAEATAMGYLFYESYHAANASQAAYSVEDYVRGTYPFYDETLNRHYTVYLDYDLDFYDWQMTSIGNDSRTPFKGFFDGKMHTISNLNMEDEYLFKYIDAAAVRNLKIESTHKVSLVNQGTNTCYIIGIDLRAHSTTNAIAASLTSDTYNNPSYVVGCIHVGDAGGALVGASDNLYMYGCMQASEGLTSGTGALLGTYLTVPHNNNSFLKPQISFDWNNMSAKVSKTPVWGRFMCNYYDTQLSPGTNAVGNITDMYSPLEYIRGRESFILKAKNDNLLRGEVSFGTLKTVQQRLSYYGLAPWKAMNYGIYRFNRLSIGAKHTCTAHYENNSTGYVHRYPELKAGEPAAEQYANVLEQNN